ncbi:DHC10 [Scenedesmus sp. PABB004]|nr:DHC10 [Scenedesmus sp. PABB004]
MFPGLVNATTIDWFCEWPADALCEVATRQMAGESLGSDEVKAAVAKMFVTAHQSVESTSRALWASLRRRNYVTPTNYLETRPRSPPRRALLAEKRAKLLAKSGKLTGGLAKLDETRAQVTEMKVVVQGKQVVVTQAKADCEELLVEIVQDKRVNAEATKIAKETEEANAIAQQVSAELDKALPALEEAEAALNVLTKKDISELKAYSKPPALVELTLSGVMTVLKRPPSWEEAKKALGDASFMSRLLNFDKDGLDEALLKKLAKLTAAPEFSPDAVGKVSLAARGLCMWVRAMEVYGRVAKDVGPKRARLRAAQDNLARKQAALAAAQEALAAVLAKVKALRDRYEESTARKTVLEAELTDLEGKLLRAEKLVTGLAGERVRWQGSIAGYEQFLAALPGDALLAAAFLSYAGPFPSEFRDELVRGTWMGQVKALGIPCSEGFDFCGFLADPSSVRDWNIQGLPADAFSTENGVMGQAVRWIRSMEAGAGLRVLSPTAPDLLRQLEAALAHGRPVLLAGVGEEIDPVLDPLLAKAFVRRGASLVVKLGDKEAEVAPGFKLYLSTKLANPHYAPEVSTRAMVVSFAVKESGLEAQLLAAVVKAERPDLDREKGELVVKVRRRAGACAGACEGAGASGIRGAPRSCPVRAHVRGAQVAAGKRTQLELEDTILQLLANASGSLLDNVELIDTLDASKTTWEEVIESLRVAEDTARQIEAAAAAYRPCSVRAAVLFFVLNDLAGVDPMYQFSLDAYAGLFALSIKASPRPEGLPERIKALNEHHTYAVYAYAARALFERHKLLLSLQMCVRVLAAAGQVNAEEWAFFLRGSQVLDRSALPPNPCPGWVSEAAWDNLANLDALPAFKGLAGSLDAAGADWEAWFRAPEPEAAELPREWEAKLNELQRLLLLRSLRPDRVVFAATTFVANALGRRFVEPPLLDLGDALAASSPSTPLIFVLSPGVDPTEPLRKLAAERDMAGRLHTAPTAQRLVEEGARAGHWVFLANCHLMTSWLPSLEKLIEGLEAGAPHERFRLWLSSAPSADFPASILQRGLKMTTEPPKGLRANLTRLYAGITEEGFAACAASAKYQKLLFALAYYHSVLLERRKFRSLGLNVPYDFNDTDFRRADRERSFRSFAPAPARAAANSAPPPGSPAPPPPAPPLPAHAHASVSDDLLKSYLAAPGPTPWAALHYLIAEANYGGRVTDELDRRVLASYMSRFFCEDALEAVNFKLSPLPAYFIPEPGSLGSFRDYIATLPTTDRRGGAWGMGRGRAAAGAGPRRRPRAAAGARPTRAPGPRAPRRPEAFGQHANAEMNYLIEDSKALLEGLAGLAPRTGAGGSGGGAGGAPPGGGRRREELVEAIAADLLDTVPAPFNLEAVMRAKQDDPSALHVVLFQEIERYNALLVAVRRGCAELVRGIKGLVVMSADLDQVFDALYGGKVPPVWLRCYPSLKPLGAWTRDLLARLDQLARWADGGYPRIYWLGGFTYPTGFLTAVLQTTARRSGVAIDSLGFEHGVVNAEERSIAAPPREGVYVKGLFLEGGGWDYEGGCLCEPAPMELIVPMPILHFKPAEARKRPGRGHYACPLYLYPTRSGARERPSYMATVDLRAGGAEPEHWVMRGTALLLSLAA